MFSYHAGAITGLDTSPVAHFVATCGVDRTVISALVESLELICLVCFNNSVGVSLFIWAQHQNASKFW